MMLSHRYLKYLQSAMPPHILTTENLSIKDIQQSESAVKPRFTGI